MHYKVWSLRGEEGKRGEGGGEGEGGGREGGMNIRHV